MFQIGGCGLRKRGPAADAFEKPQVTELRPSRGRSTRVHNPRSGAKGVPDRGLWSPELASNQSWYQQSAKCGTANQLEMVLGYQVMKTPQHDPFNAKKNPAWSKGTERVRMGYNQGSSGADAVPFKVTRGTKFADRWHQSGFLLSGTGAQLRTTRSGEISEQTRKRGAARCAQPNPPGARRSYPPRERNARAPRRGC